MAIECVTFDLDDTLWDVAPVIQRAELSFFAWLSERCPRIAQRFDVESLLAQRSEFFKQFPDQRHDLTWLRKQWLADLFQTYGYPNMSVDVAFKVFWEQRNDVSLYDDVPAVLAGLRERYAVGVISNGNACVDFIGIGHYFDFVVSAEHAGAAKPNPEIFRAALSEAGVQPHRAVHVGDDPRNDVLGAAAVGMRTIWYNPSLQPWPGGQTPDAVIRSLAELDEALNRLG